jgi:L,D-peptidoglycan transpeptidase YkuD (ErfK/YbiS/YcfS/YnhG family)
MRFLAIGVLALASCPGLGGSGVAPIPIPSTSRQLVLVIADRWESSSAKLQRFERKSSGGPWQPVSAPIDASLGRSGLGWGIGVHWPREQGPLKQEGDGRSPAGIFRLTSAFGYGPMATHLPYTLATPTLECVDDPASPRYNTLVDAATGERSWTSSEKMRRDDELYRVGVFVAHNAERPTPGKGSCIFLHVWRGPGQPTVGCTATARDEMEALVGWLDAKKEPVLVQLPRQDYDALVGIWRLPEIPNENDPGKRKP